MTVFRLLLIVLACIAAPLMAAPVLGGEPRLVTIGGAVTETVIALGLGGALAAVDTTSTFPEELTGRLPKVGYMRQLSAEGVIALHPTHVLAIEGSGPPEALMLMREAGISLTAVPERFSGEGVVAKIRAIGRDLDVAGPAGALATRVERQFAALAAGNGQVRTPVRVLFALSALNGRLTASGRGTAADAAIRLAGAVNAIEGFDGYKPLSDEAIIAARPDAIVVMDRAGQKPEEVLAYPALAATPAAAARRFIVMDGMYLLGFGPRAPQALAELRQRLYPDVAFQPLEPAP